MNLEINTIISFLILLPVSIAILNLWIWIFHNIFDIKKDKKDILKTTIILWLISWLSIILYPKLTSYFDLNSLNFTNYDNLWNFNLIFWFWIYLSWIVFLIRLFLKLKPTNFFLLNFIIFSIIFLLWWYISNEFITTTALIYYSFVALWEEFIKYLIWVNFFEKRKISYNDIIIFSILSAIWFAFIENIVYLIWSIWWKELMISLVWWGSLILTRGIIGFLVHIIFTWNIWQFSKNIWKSFMIYLSLGITFGVLLHYFYDVLLHNNYKFVILVALIWWYFWISYLFYTSNSIYVKEGLEA